MSRFTFYDNKAHRHPQRLADYLAGKPIVPVTLDIDLSDRCNAKCPACVGGRGEDSPELKTNVLLSFLECAREEGVESVVFTGGGEPTLHNAIVYLIREAKEMGFEVAMVTNGLRYAADPDLVEAVVECCTWTRISLDASSPKLYQKTHGIDGYKKVRRGIWNLVGKRACQGRKELTIGTAFLTNRETIKESQKAIHAAQRIGADYIYFRPFLGDTTGLPRLKWPLNFGVVWASAYDLFDETEKPYRICGFGWWVSVVKADGNVTWCCRFREKEQYYLGNIYQDSFDKIMERRKDIKVDFNDCALLCRGDQMNRFLWQAQKPVMHEAFL